MALNYNSFIKLIKEHYIYDIEKEDLARGLLESITNHSIHPKFSSTYLSYIWNGERNVTKEITDESEKASSKKRCFEHFDNTITVELSPHLIDDFYDKLNKLISDDTTISEAKKNSLKKIYDSKDYTKYLNEIFLYAIKRPNKSIVSNIGPDDVDLLNEVNQECPLCRTPLVEVRSKKPFFRYSISKIFPEGLSLALSIDFNKVHKEPIDLNDKNNLICLCDKCASDYLYSPDTSTYDKLYRYKWQSLETNDLKKTTSRYHIEVEIIQILDNIKDADYDSDSFKILRMIPVKITNKILPDNQILLKTIRDDVDSYFYFIKDHLATIDDFKHSFKQIALEVKTCYLSIAKKIADQDEAYNALVQWILDTQRLPISYKLAAQIVISFFVQNCEVFDEISK